MGVSERSIAKILSAWGIEPLKISLGSPVWRVETADGLRCLKSNTHDSERSTYLALALEHLRAGGFHKMPRFFSTKKGRLYHHQDGRTYWLYEWIDGPRADYRQTSDLIECTRTLAEFHQAARQLPLPYRLRPKSRIAAWPKKFRERTSELKVYQRRLSRRLNPDGFQETFLPVSDWLIAQAHEAAEVLQGKFYRYLCRQAAAEHMFTHGDVAANNMIMTGPKGACLIDFDSLAEDLHLVDLWRHLSRCLWAVNWDRAFGQLILKVYKDINPLTAQEQEILWGFLAFPQWPWRLAHQYLANHQPAARLEWQKIVPLLGNGGPIANCLISLRN